MTIDALAWQQVEATLSQHYPDNEVRIMLQQLKAAYSIGRLQLNEAELITAIESHTPIQYITGTVYFADFELEVAPGVLIPRPETDELVYWVRQSHPHTADYDILDIGTGSGCIAIAMARTFPQASVRAIDISEKALEIAARNATRIGVTIQFEVQDICKVASTSTMHDIIISNPPYILPTEAKAMEPHVLDHEPASALFVTNQDPLQFYKAIEKYARQTLKADGYLYLELHSLYALDTKQYYEAMGWEATLKVDMQGMPRMLRCKKSNSID